MKKSKILLYSAIIVFVVLSLVLAPFFGTGVEGAKKTLKSSGYIPIEVGGYSYFSGSKSDFFRTKFKAISISKDTVTGVVTKGLFFKGSTIRLD